MPSYSGVWSLPAQMQAKANLQWPQGPGAPTSVTASAGDASADVSFTAPTFTGAVVLPATTTAIGTAFIKSGTGSPEGVVSAPVGSLYLRTDGGANTTLYVKESGASTTGWTAK